MHDTPWEREEQYSWNSNTPIGSAAGTGGTGRTAREEAIAQRAKTRRTGAVGYGYNATGEGEAGEGAESISRDASGEHLSPDASRDMLDLDRDEGAAGAVAAIGPSDVLLGEEAPGQARSDARARAIDEFVSSDLRLDSEEGVRRTLNALAALLHDRGADHSSGAQSGKGGGKTVYTMVYDEGKKDYELRQVRVK